MPAIMVQAIAEKCGFCLYSVSVRLFLYINLVGFHVRSLDIQLKHVFW